MSRIRDSVPKIGTTKGPVLDILFCLYHYYAIGSQFNQPERIQESKPQFCSIKMLASYELPANYNSLISNLYKWLWHSLEKYLEKNYFEWSANIRLTEAFIMIGATSLLLGQNWYPESWLASFSCALRLGRRSGTQLLYVMVIFEFIHQFKD